MHVKNCKLLLWPVLWLLLSCSNPVNKLFGKKTAHEIYADKVEKSPAGKQWVAVSENVLQSPYTIQLPYRHAGHFPLDKLRAFALQFSVKQGERITVEVAKKNGVATVIYTDVFKLEGSRHVHILSADTAKSSLSFEADETATYILRLQPALYHTASYNLSVSVGPSLSFPVAGTKAKTGSFWGDARDAGKRLHEGIDIFAPKLTPAIAAADGYVTKVDEGGLGGKTVWMKVADRNIHLYYAHLHKQLVQDGQTVKKGDTVGLIGNTGNATHTAAHLHFGIYNNEGALDPWPFVNKVVKTAPAITPKDLTVYLQFKNPIVIPPGTQESANPVLIPLAVNADGYIAELPDGKMIHAPFKTVKNIDKQKAPLPTQKLKVISKG